MLPYPALGWLWAVCCNIGDGLMKSFMEVEDLEVYQKLCKLHLEVCDLSHRWPKEEKYELGSQVRRSSNSAPAQLARRMTIAMSATRSKVSTEHAVR